MFMDIDVYCIQTAAAHTIMLDLLYRKAATRIHAHVHLDPVPPMCLDESFFSASVASPPMFRRDDERTCPSLASLSSFLHIQPLQDPHMRSERCAPCARCLCRGSAQSSGSRTA